MQLILRAHDRFGRASESISKLPLLAIWTQCVQAAVNKDRLAGDCGGGGSQEKGGFSAFGNGGKSLQWRHAFFGLKRRIGIWSTGKLRADESRRNRVDANFRR